MIHLVAPMTVFAVGQVPFMIPAGGVQLPPFLGPDSLSYDVLPDAPCKPFLVLHDASAATISRIVCKLHQTLGGSNDAGDRENVTISVHTDRYSMCCLVTVMEGAHFDSAHDMVAFLQEEVLTSANDWALLDLGLFQLGLCPLPGTPLPPGTDAAGTVLSAVPDPTLSDAHAIELHNYFHDDYYVAMCPAVIHSTPSFQ